MGWVEFVCVLCRKTFVTADGIEVGGLGTVAGESVQRNVTYTDSLG